MKVNARHICFYPMYENCEKHKLKAENEVLTANYSELRAEAGDVVKGLAEWRGCRDKGRTVNDIAKYDLIKAIDKLSALLEVKK